MMGWVGIDDVSDLVSISMLMTTELGRVFRTVVGTRRRDPTEEDRREEQS